MVPLTEPRIYNKKERISINDEHTPHKDSVDEKEEITCRGESQPELLEEARPVIYPRHIGKDPLDPVSQMCHQLERWISSCRKRRVKWMAQDKRNIKDKKKHK